MNGNTWQIIKAIINYDPFDEYPHKLFNLNAYMLIFCSIVASITASSVLIEYCSGPLFIKRVLIAIIIVGASIILV